MGKPLIASRRRFLALCLLIVAAGIGGSLVHWRAWMAGVDETPVPNAAASAAPRAAGAADATATSAASVAAAADAAAWPVAGGQRDSGGVPIPPEGVEICGVRRVPADELQRWKADPGLHSAGAQQLQAQMQEIGKVGLARISARLAAGNERQQVAARLLMRDTDGAALLAERSSDAQAYQMALSACGGPFGGTPNCARLSARRWAELDPSDARPWLRLMAQAQGRRDAAAVDAAMAEASRRPRLSRGAYLLEAHAMSVADVVPDAAVLGHALPRIIFNGAAIDYSDAFALYRVCRGEGLRNPERLAHCLALSRHVLANAGDINEAQTAQTLADRVGVPSQQQAYDAKTLKAAQTRLSELGDQAFGMHDCPAMQRIKSFSAERGAAGELAMALALLRAPQPAR